MIWSFGNDLDGTLGGYQDIELKILEYADEENVKGNLALAQ